MTDVPVGEMPCLAFEACVLYALASNNVVTADAAVASAKADAERLQPFDDRASSAWSRHLETYGAHDHRTRARYRVWRAFGACYRAAVRRHIDALRASSAAHRAQWVAQRRCERLEDFLAEQKQMTTEYRGCVAR